jgi:hypothetical protein
MYVNGCEFYKIFYIVEDFFLHIANSLAHIFFQIKKYDILKSLLKIKKNYR